uniref:THUMP-like domain-containing protein n=1 Tax=Flavobacterium sp. TaxID=239 RepID=UPI00404B38DF
MEIEILLKPEIQEFINSNLDADIKLLALKKNPFPEVNYAYLINQIVAKQKAKLKLPTWFKTKNILFPAKISIEQTSSEKTAQYKANLVSGKTLIDLTGGFGIDDYYFSKKVEQVKHCEINEELSKIVQHNFNKLEVNNIECINVNSTNFLNETDSKYDSIYVDPSRRSNLKGKVFMLKDCEPNVPDLLDLYFSKSNNILIKTAPILDIQAGINELKNVKEVHIVALENEVKELLWTLEKNYTGVIKINSVSIEKETVEIVETVFNKEYIATFSLPKIYLYEPNVSLLKSGNFNAISTYYNIEKLHLHSHLYTSDRKINFAGRSFKIDKIIPFQKKEIKEVILNSKMNVTTRNFPLKVEEIKKKYKIKDGGTIYAFFTTNLENQKIVLICTKI